MMAQPLVVYLPCEVFPVRVRFGQRNDLTRIELLILRAIHAGEHNIYGLAKLFGFYSDSGLRSERMMLDALRGLWRGGHLVFNFDSQSVYLSAQSAKMIEDKEYKKLWSTPNGYEEIPLMFDLVTGRVLPLSGRQAPPAANKIIPYAHGAVRLDHVTYDGIQTALAATLSSGRSRFEGLKVLEANVGFRSTPEGPPLRWLQTQVTCHAADDENEGLEVRVLDTNALPFSVRQALSQHLTRAANDEANIHFINRLRRNASGGRTTPREEIGRLFRELEATVAGLAQRPPGEAPALHEDLKPKARLAAEIIAEEMTSEASIEVVVGQDAHRRVVEEMMKAAGEQIVISSPFVSDFDWMRAPIESALEAGKRVLILWGVTRRGDELLLSQGGEPQTQRAYDLLPGPVKNVIEDFKSNPRYGKSFFFSQRPAGTHAKVVVCDNKSVFVTSMNLLRRISDDIVEIGVLARPAPRHEGERGRKSVAVASDILTWAREIVPDMNIANAIIFWPKDVEEPLKQPALHPLLEPAEKSDEEPDEERRRDAMSVWASSWVAHLATLRRYKSVARRCARLVRDQDHRQLFDRAIRYAQQRLVVTSDQISRSVVSRQTLTPLRSLPRTVPVRMVYRSPLRSRLSEGEAAVQDLMELERTVNDEGGDFQSLRAENNHSKVLIHDSAAVVSSFNFLSHAGQYASTRGSHSAELGLALTGPGVADEVSAAVIGAFPLRPVRAAAAAAGSVPVSMPDVTSVLEALAGEEVSKSEIGVSLAAVFEAADNPWALLEGIPNLPLTNELKRRVVATCLAIRGRDENRAAYDGWVKYLAQDAWVRGDAIESYLLLSVLSEGERGIEGLPHPSLVEIAAARRSSPVGELLLAAALEEELPPGQQSALAMTAVAEVLQRGSTEDRELASTLGEYLPETWRAALGSVLEYYDQFFEAFPHALLASYLSNREQMQKLEAALDQLQKNLEDAEGKQFRFVLATKAWEHLFHASGLFGRLLAMARNRDAAGIQSWFKGLHSRDPHDILLDATYGAFEESREVIEFRLRERLEKVIKKILDDARAVRNYYDEQMFILQHGPLVDAARKLALDLSVIRGGLAAEVEAAVDESARLLSAAAFSDLERVMRYSATYENN